MCFIQVGCANPSFHGRHFFETSGMLISFVVLGKYLESVAKARTSNSLTNLMSMKVEHATLLRPIDDDDDDDSDDSSSDSSDTSIDSRGSDDGKNGGRRRQYVEEEIDPKLLQPGDVVKVRAR